VASATSAGVDLEQRELGTHRDVNFGRDVGAPDLRVVALRHHLGRNGRYESCLLTRSGVARQCVGIAADGPAVGLPSATFEDGAPLRERCSQFCVGREAVWTTVETFGRGFTR
jgi:hypothetical protein